MIEASAPGIKGAVSVHGGQPGGGGGSCVSADPGFKWSSSSGADHSLVHKHTARDVTEAEGGEGGDDLGRRRQRTEGSERGRRRRRTEKCVDQEDEATDKQTDAPTADSGFFQFFQVVQGRSSSRPGEASSKLAANGHAYAPTLRPRQSGVSQMTRGGAQTQPPTDGRNRETAKHGAGSLGGIFEDLNSKCFPSSHNVLISSRQ